MSLEDEIEAATARLRQWRKEQREKAEAPIPKAEIRKVTKPRLTDLPPQKRYSPYSERERVI
jgi:hypothetical protein